MTGDELLNEFLEAAKLEPDDPLVLYGLGNEYLKLRRYQEAIQTFAHLIEIQEDYSAAYRQLGQAYAGIGEPLMRSRGTKPASR